MTTNFSGAPEVSGSARIYQFPPRGRFAAGQGSQGDASAPAANVQLPRGIRIASGSGWYHDAAIQEAIKAERAGKN
ncbi:MAG: DUF2735 domain-containing protein [Xanthobacteraceae bacterium]|nr:DUF2735 domain-containing protein [Xanthobacteraceae bacterium]